MSKLNVYVVYEDDYLIVANKDAGVLVDKPTKINLLPKNHLIDIITKTYTHLKASNLFLAHRLDRFTSGLLVIAKDRDTLSQFENMFLEHSIEKTYHAIVSGSPKSDSGIIDKAIGRDKNEPNKRILTSIKNGGKSAVTIYRVINKLRGHTLLELKPKTGRTHQLRVHCQAMGCPIIGDKTYSYDSKNYKMQGFALMSKSISFTHPKTGKKLKISTDYSEEFSYWLNRLSI